MFSFFIFYSFIHSFFLLFISFHFVLNSFLFSSSYFFLRLLFFMFVCIFIINPFSAIVQYLLIFFLPFIFRCCFLNISDTLMLSLNARQSTSSCVAQINDCTNPHHVCLSNKISDRVNMFHLIRNFLTIQILCCQSRRMQIRKRQ